MTKGWSLLQSHDIILVLFSGLSNRATRENIKSLETGASLLRSLPCMYKSILVMYVVESALFA